MRDKSNFSMMYDQLKQRGIKENILKTFESIDRSRFILPEYRCLAYADSPLPIECDQTISQPFIVALMTQHLDIKKTDKVLEIGTGSGYQTAILATLCEEVVTIERHQTLHDKSKALLKQLGYSNITFVLKDGSLGYEEEAPYDRIIVTAAARKTPEALLNQLKVGGKMIIPLGNSLFQNLVLIKKLKDKIKTENLGGCRFVPLVLDSK